MAASFRLSLRREIGLREGALRDSLTHASYPLDELGHAIVTALENPATVETLVGTLAAGGRFGGDGIERQLRRMLLLGFFEATCETIRVRLQRIRGGENPPPSVLEGSRFGCRNSGACCRGYLFGYIGAEEKARIEALGPRNALPRLGDRPLFIEEPPSSGRPVYRLETDGDACVFLEDDKSCGLHRAFGADAKPGFCRLYPLAAMTTVDGLKIYDRGECSTFAVSANSGTPLGDDLPRILALCDRDVFHPVVQVHGTWRCDYGLVLALARRLDAEASAKPPLHALHAIGHVTRRFVMALARCPLEAGQPEAAAAAALAEASDQQAPADEAVAANARVGLASLAILARGLAERVVASERFGEAFIAAARVLAEIGRDGLGETSSCEITRLLPAVTLGVDCQRAMRMSLRLQIFGRELLLDDRLPAGLLRMAFVALLTSAGAKLNARADGADTVAPRHFSRAHMVAKRTLHRPGPHGLLRANGEQVWPILDALPLIAKQLGFADEGSSAATPSIR